MGTGGATALLSPECGTALAVSLLSQRRKREAESLMTIAIDFQRTRFQIINLRSEICNRWFSDIYIQGVGTRTLRLRFILRSFVSSVCHPAYAGWVNRKVKDQAERVISTPELNTLLCLHPEPINVVVYHDPSGRSHLGIGLALRCFQRLSFPNIATQHCR